MPKLQQKNAVVTGASSGIGKAIALAFAREDANVIVNYYQSADKAEAVAESIRSTGGRALAVQADVGDPESIVSLLNKARSEFGSIDIWVNNAGMDILTGSGAELMDEHKLERLIDVDLKGTINCCWALAPLMLKQGHGVIINMAWDLAIHGFQGANPQMFAAVKAGVLGFSRAYAKSYGPEIRVNVIAPGWIQTAFAEDLMDKDYYQERVNEIPLGRFGKPEDIAETAVFLASDDSSYITGEMIKVNGGLS